MAQDYPTNVKRWDVFEVQLQGPAEGNPFLDHTLTGIFTGRNESVTVKGFYDGDGIYKIRFMPSFTGKYNFILQSSFIKGSLSGTFFVKDNDEKNHGVARIRDTYDFMYEDGTACHPFSSTSYRWYLQSEETMQDTIDSLDKAGIKRLRFEAMTDEESMFVNKDYDTYSISHLHKLEKAVQMLAEAGIEADLILFGKATVVNEMSSEQKVSYINMISDRFGAYHNVWWTLSRDPEVTDLHKAADALAKRDVYRHLRSVSGNFDSASNWASYCSIESSDLYSPAERTNAIREWYHKPVIMDGIGMEGDQPYFEGALSGKELLRRCYETVIRGGYPSLSEAYGDNLFRDKGGIFKGEAVKRLSFLTKLLYEVPGKKLNFVNNPDHIPEGFGSDGTNKQYLFYFGYLQSHQYTFHLDDTAEYAVDVIDTWNMEIQSAGIYQGEFAIELPDIPYLLIRLRKPEESDYHPSEKEEETPVSEETEVLPADEITDDDTAEDSNYMEAEVITDKNELAQPHEEMDEGDGDVMHEEVMHVSEEPSSPYPEEAVVEEEDMDTDEDELPDIISGPSVEDALDHTAELRKMPVEGETVPESEKSHTLNILTRRARRQK